jgi:hypothetical protein
MPTIQSPAAVVVAVTLTLSSTSASDGSCSEGGGNASTVACGAGPT